VHTKEPTLSLQDGATLRDFITRIEQGIYIVTPEGRIVDANPALLDIFHAESLQQLQQYHSEDLVPDPEVLRERRRLIKEQGWIRDFRYRIRTLDGVLRSVRDTVFAQRDEDGAVVAMHGILDLIDEQGQAVEEDFGVPLSAFFTGAPAGLAILDVELRFVRINRRLAEMHVLPAPEHVGRALGDVLPGLAPLIEPILSGVLESGTPAVNAEVATEDPRAPGRARVWRLSAFPVGPSRGSVTGIGMVVIDITDSKRLEEQAKLDGRYLAALIESCPLAMATLDPSGCLVAVNAAFEKLFLLPREEALGQELDALIAPPEQIDEARELTRRAQQGECLRILVERQRRDGSQVRLRAYSSPIVLDGRHLGAHLVYENMAQD